MRLMPYDELPTFNTEGGGLVLRPIRESDTADIIRWRNSPTVRSCFIYQDELTAEHHLAWFHDKVMKGSVVQYLAIERSSELPIGSVYYQHFDDNASRAEFGIFIGEDIARGKGYGSDLCKSFTTFGICELQLHSVYARVLSDNIPSRRIFLRNGYKEEGIARDMVRIGDEYRDVVFYSYIAQGD